MNNTPDTNKKHAVFGGGCFWCTEALFQSLKGVESVTSGYSGGEEKDATYDKASVGNTGHAEVIRIVYDSDEISFEDLLSVFFNTHNPTTLNQQGADVGTQYRSIIFYTDKEQQQVASRVVRELNESHAYDNPVVTEIVPFKSFFPAEDYHQNYYKNHSDATYCELVIAPKLEKLNKRFQQLLKK